MKKQEFKFTLGNGSEREETAESLSSMLASLPMGEKLRMQRRIMEEKGRSKKVVNKASEPTQLPAQTLSEAIDREEEFKPTAEQIAEFNKIMNEARELDAQIKALEEEIQRDLEEKENEVITLPAEPKTETPEEIADTKAIGGLKNTNNNLKKLLEDEEKQKVVDLEIKNAATEQLLINLRTEKPEVVVSELERIGRTDHELYEKSIQRLIENEVIDWRTQVTDLRVVGKDYAIPVLVQKYEDRVDELLKKAKGEPALRFKEDIEFLKNLKNKILKNKENNLSELEIKKADMEKRKGEEIEKEHFLSDMGDRERNKFLKDPEGYYNEKISEINKILSKNPDADYTTDWYDKQLKKLKETNEKYDAYIGAPETSGQEEPTYINTSSNIETPKTVEEYRNALIENESFFHLEDRKYSALLSRTSFEDSVKFRNLSKQDAIEEMVSAFKPISENNEVIEKTDFSMKPFFPEGGWSSTPEKTEHLSEKGVLFKIGDPVKYEGESMGRITGFDDNFAYLEKNNNSEDKRPINTYALEKE